MKRKIRIQFLNDKPDELEINCRDVEFISIISKHKSNVFKNKKKYNRKVKHKNKD